MKSIVFHISDIHISSEFNDFLIKRFLESFNFANYTKAIFAFNGDIAYSGKEEEYQFFNSFLGKIKKAVCEKNCEFVFLSVPGNHDINYSLIDFCPSEIFKKMYSNILYYQNKYLDSQMCYFNYVKSQNSSLFNSSKICQRFEYDVGNGYLISFALINTSPFSSKEKDDKGKHYIASNDVNQLLIKNSSIQFTVMHHSKEWFDEESNSSISNLLNNFTDILLVSHEHDPESVLRKSEKKHDYLINRSGLFDQKEIDKISFHTFEIDTMDKICVECSYKLKVENKIQFFAQEKVLEFPILMPDEYSNKISKKFIDSFSKIPFYGSTEIGLLDDIFVFPRLVNSKDEIITLDSFTDYLEKKKILNISGSESMGKTILLYYLFLRYNGKNEQFCIYLKGVNIPKHYRQKEFIEDNIREQLSSKYFYQKFSLTEKNNRILLIDDFDYCKLDRNAFIDLARERFGKIIFTTSFNYDKYRYRIENSDEIEEINIAFYTKSQRDTIVKNICKTRRVSNENMDEIIYSINSMATYSSLEELCNPFYVSLLTNNIISQGLHYRAGASSSTYSETFGLSLEKMLEKNQTNYSIDEKIIILSYLAYSMFINRIYYFAEEEFIKIKDELLDKRSISLNVTSFINDMVEIRLFVLSSNGKYKFTKNSFLAYFIAYKIRMNRNMDDINTLLANIEYGIYGDILLFIVYDSFDLNLFKCLEEDITKMWENCSKLDFKACNNPILARYKGDLKFLLESRKSIEQRVDAGERKRVKDLKTKEENAFNNTDSFSKDEHTIKRTVKLIEILGKAVSAFKIQIDNDLRVKMITLIKNTTFKVLYKIFEISDKEMEFFEKDLMNKIRNEPRLNKLSFSDIITYLYDEISTISLNLITGVCNIWVSKNSITCLDRCIDNSNENELLFKNIALERYGDKEKYTSFIESAYPNLCESIKYMSRRVTGLFLVYHPEIDTNNMNKICSTQKLDKQKVLNVLANKKGILNNLNEKKDIKEN